MYMAHGAHQMRRRRRPRAPRTCRWVWGPARRRARPQRPPRCAAPPPAGSLPGWTLAAGHLPPSATRLSPEPLMQPLLRLGATLVVPVPARGPDMPGSVLAAIPTRNFQLTLTLFSRTSCAPRPGRCARPLRARQVGRLHCALCAADVHLRRPPQLHYEPKPPEFHRPHTQQSIPLV